MTDSRLQELKRAWEASGSVEDEAAYLGERVRVGDLCLKEYEQGLATWVADWAPSELSLYGKPVRKALGGLSNRQACRLGLHLLVAQNRCCKEQLPPDLQRFLDAGDCMKPENIPPRHRGSGSLDVPALRKIASAHRTLLWSREKYIQSALLALVEFNQAGLFKRLDREVVDRVFQSGMRDLLVSFLATCNARDADSPPQGLGRRRLG